MTTCNPIETITPPPTPKLVDSLSGNPADYRFVASAPGEIVLTAIDSKERFVKTKAKLEAVVEEQRKLEKDREALQRAYVYTKILDGKPLTAYSFYDSPKSLNKQSCMNCGGHSCRNM